MPRAHSANTEIIRSTPPTVSSPYLVPTSDDPKALRIKSRHQRDASIAAASVPDDKPANPANQQVWQRQLMLLERQHRRRLMLRPQMLEPPRDQAPTEQNPASSDTLILQPTAPASTIDVTEGVPQMNAVSMPMGKMTPQQYQDLWQQRMLAQHAAQQQQLRTQARLQALQRTQKQHDSQWVQTSRSQSLTNQAPQSQPNPALQTRLESAISISHQLQDYQMQLMLLEQQNRKRLIAHNQAIDQGLLNYVKEEDETTFRCMVSDQDCIELFKGRDYWKWHVDKEHKDWYQEFRDSVGHSDTECQLSMVVRNTSRPAAAGPTTTQALSNEKSHRLLSPPVVDFFSDRSTLVAESQEPIEAYSAEPVINVMNVTLPIRLAASKTAHEHDTPIAIKSSFGCVSQHPSRAQCSTRRSGYESPDVEQISPMQSWENRSATMRPDNHAYVSDSSLGKPTASNNS